MIYTEAAGKKVSKLSLGTVQLGMNYGIANQGGQPSLARSHAMLRAALTGGVTALDTARDYGESEDVLGSFLKNCEGETPFITTKVPRFEAESAAEAERFVTESVEASLDRLRVKKVSCVMLHNVYNLFHGAEAAAKAMEGLIRRGYTDLVGASVYLAFEAEEMLRYPVYTAIQAPMSAFDQRFITSGVLKKLSDRGVLVFVRSVFLQGLFFLDPDKITDPILLEKAKPKILAFRRFAEEEGLSVAQLAIAFMRDVPGITSLVLGADTEEQVRENLAYFETPPIRESTRAAMTRAFSDTDIPAIMQVLSRPKR